MNYNARKEALKKMKKYQAGGVANDFDPEEFDREGQLRLAEYMDSKQKGIVSPDMGDSESGERELSMEDRLARSAAYFDVPLKGRSPASEDEMIPNRLEKTIPDDADPEMARKILMLKMLKGKPR